MPLIPSTDFSKKSQFFRYDECNGWVKFSWTLAYPFSALCLYVDNVDSHSNLAGLRFSP